MTGIHKISVTMSIFTQYIIVFLFIYIFSSVRPKDDDKELWESARKSLGQKTREYIKEHPISDDLRSFIDDLAQTSNRKKRQGNMYAIKNGEVVPMEQLEEQFNTDSNLGPDFTVVPLLIPIALENTVTLKNRQMATENSFHGDGSERAILGRGEALLAAKGKSNKQDLSEINKDSKDGEEVVNNLIEEKLKSTSESNELSKVLEDVENLISAQKKASNKEGILCNVSGYWDSKSGGMTFHLKKVEDKVKIRMRPTEPPCEDGFIKGSWNVTAKIPFAQFSQVVIMLTAHKGRRVALFLGECRVCDGSETITGDWLISRTSNNCNDQKAAHSFISDIFRKNNVETLKNAHKDILSTATTGAASTESYDKF